MQEPLVRLVGLALRARRVAVGREACRRAAGSGSLHAIVLAADAGASAERDSGAAGGVRVVRSSLDRRELGALVGRESLAVLGITDPEFAAGIAAAGPARKKRETGAPRASGPRRT